jgi:transcriptional regulator with XRE-family HTH domain
MSSPDAYQRRREIGRRVAYWRTRRGLTRQQFADLVGRSVSWVDKIESGERALLRLPLLEQVAEVLHIAVETLTDKTVAERAVTCVDPAEVQTIRAALGKYPGLSAQGAEVVSVSAIRGQADYLEHAWSASRFTVVAGHLPKLMADAQRALYSAPEEEKVEIFRALVTAYRLASSMLLKFEVKDVAWLAADRAIHTALQVDDTWSLARATRSVARAMSSSQQGPDAITALLAMGDRMRAETNSDEHNLLALYGMVYLAASITAAEQEDAALAQDMHREALAAAQRFQPHFDGHYTLFGVTNVLIHRVSALVRLYQPGQALEFAVGIDPGNVAALSAERRANFLLDLTEAHATAGNHHRRRHCWRKPNALRRRKCVVGQWPTRCSVLCWIRPEARRPNLPNRWHPVRASTHEL